MQVDQLLNIKFEIYSENLETVAVTSAQVGKLFHLAC